jgi:hypothetical protein
MDSYFTTFAPIVVALSNGVLLWVQDVYNSCILHPYFPPMYYQLRIDVNMYSKMSAEERVRFVQPFWVRGESPNAEDKSLPFEWKQPMSYPFQHVSTGSDDYQGYTPRDESTFVSTEPERDMRYYFTSECPRNYGGNTTVAARLKARRR